MLFVINHFYERINRWWFPFVPETSDGMAHYANPGSLGKNVLPVLAESQAISWVEVKILMEQIVLFRLLYQIKIKCSSP